MRKLTWGEDRVFYYDSSGKLRSLLTNVTDVSSKDAFDRISAGRSAFRVDDLLELRHLFDKRMPHAQAQPAASLPKLSMLALISQNKSVSLTGFACSCRLKKVDA